MSLFLKAIDVLNERGWRQNQYYDDDLVAGGACCVVGALAVVARQLPWNLDTLPEWKVLTKEVSSPIAYNDEPGRTKEDIIELLRKAHAYECAQVNQTEPSSAQPA